MKYYELLQTNFKYNVNLALSKRIFKIILYNM